jgi:transposase
MQGKKDYTEKLFTPFQLSERVPIDNFYRRLKQALDLRFLTKATAQYYGTEGQKSIDPVVFFKLILVGYLENLNSDRRIIEHAKMRLDILYFIGYDIDEELPWHSTLSRTRQLYGEEVFLQLFRQVLKLCIDKGMVSGRRQAVDSAYIKANASMDSLVEKEVLDDAGTFTEELENNDEDPQKKTP